MGNFKYDNGQLSLGQPAPGFDLPGVDGKNHSLADYAGKVKGLAVIFSCNHCPWVIKYENRMIELGNKYMDKGIGFVLISANDVVNYPQDSFDNMKKRADQKKYPFPYLYNEKQDVAKAYGAQVTPHLFLFNADMKLVFRGSVDDNPDKMDRPTVTYLKDAIESLVAGDADIKNADTKAVGCSVKWK